MMRLPRGLPALIAASALCAGCGPARQPADPAGSATALPDWTGIWVSAATDIDISGYPAAGVNGFSLQLLGTNAPLKPELREKLTAELPRMMAADATRKAGGWGYPLMMEGIAPLQFLVTPQETLILNFYRDIRHIYTDGRGHLPEADRWPVPWGDSVGHWEGDTLVIETVSVNFGAIFPLGLPPLSENARFIERLHRTGPDRMELEVQVDDPQVLAGPWTARVAYKKATGLDRLIHDAFGNDRSEVDGDSLTIAPPR